MLTANRNWKVLEMVLEKTESTKLQSPKAVNYIAWAGLLTFSPCFGLPFSMEKVA